MWRKNDAHKDDLEGVAQRLRNERPEASPLELDQIKTSAMSRARGSKAGRSGSRRFAVSALALGLLAASTGGVIAAESGGGSGNAAVAQYSSCDVGNNGNNNNGAGNGGDNNNENNQGNCNTVNETTNNTTNNSSSSTTNNNSSSDSGNVTNTNTYNYSTQTIVYQSNSASGGTGGVLASKTTKAKTSKRSFSAHFFAAKGRKLKKLTVTVNGKVVKTLSGNKTTVNLDFVGFPCTSTKQVITLTGVLANGKKVTETRHYNLCQ